MPSSIGNFMVRQLKAPLSILLIILGLWAADPVLAAERGRTPIDGVWAFQRADAADAGSPDYDDASWSRVTLPHTFNGGDGDDGGSHYRGPAWYRTAVTMPAKSAERRYFLEFDGAALATDLWVNGRSIGRHEGGYARFRFDVTDALQAGQNSIAVSTTAACRPSPRWAATSPFSGACTAASGWYRPTRCILT